MKFSDNSQFQVSNKLSVCLQMKEDRLNQKAQ